MLTDKNTRLGKKKKTCQIFVRFQKKKRKERRPGKTETEYIRQCLLSACFSMIVALCDCKQ